MWPHDLTKGRTLLGAKPQPSDARGSGGGAPNRLRIFAAFTKKTRFSHDINQRFSTLFFCDPKSIKNLICKNSCDPRNLSVVHINTKTPKTTFIPQHSMPFRFNKFLKLWFNITQCQTHWMLCISKNAIFKSSAISKSRNKIC